MKFIIREYPDYFHLGHIMKTHGVRGDMVIFLDTDEPDRYRKLKQLWIENGTELKEYQVSKSSVNGEQAIIHLTGVEDMNAAELFLKKQAYLPLSSLPKLKGKQFYFHEIIGFEVQDETEGVLGPVTEVYDLTQHPVGEVLWKEQKVLFPLISEFIVKIDRDAKVLQVKLPEGMLDVYR